MQKLINKKYFLSLLFISVFIFGNANAAVSNWEFKGADIVPRWNTDFESDSFKQSVLNLKNDGATSVGLVIPLYQSNLYSTDIAPGNLTPTDASLVKGITYIHSLGMKVMLKPHVETYTNEWRANINPSDRNSWFANYTTMLNKYVDIAKTNNVELYVLGTELINMTTPSVNSTNTANWRKLIASVRTHYNGKLTYSSNWGTKDTWGDEKNHIEFWDALDYLSISPYFPLNTNTNNSVENFKTEWDNINKNDIMPLQKRTGKQILFPEVGYRSADGARYRPAEGAGGYSDIEQKTLYEAFLQYWNDQPNVQGTLFWDWSSDPNYGGSGNNDYTPQNKSAEGVMKNWFKGSVTPTPTTNPTFNASVTMNPTMPTKNSPINFDVSLKTATGALQNGIFDFEIYNESGQKIYQRFREGQNLAAQTETHYTETWTPTSSGKYILKIGVFSYDWSQNYYWNNSVLPFQVDDIVAPPTSTSTSKAIEIWWPTQNSYLQGTQPWKAILQNTPLNQYQMFWQVDGDRLNGMYDSQADYPHKEAVVDLSGWNWKGKNTYKINIVAKDNGGNIINQKAIDVYVNY